MPYFAKDTATPETGRTKSQAGSAGRPITDAIPLWKRGGDFAYGYYKGNYILYKYYRKDYLEESGIDPQRFRTQLEFGDSIINRALSKITDSVNNSEFSYVRKFDRSLKSVEEQPMAYGQSVPESPEGAGQGVDMKVGNKNFQVTYMKFLSDSAHHGIEKGGEARNTMVKAVSAANKDTNLTQHQKYKQIANAGLNYYRTQISQVNKVMLSMQSDKAFSAKGLRSEMKSQTQSPSKKVKEIRNKANVLMMREAMIGFTKTALSNVDKYRQGVYYTLPIELSPPVHAEIGQFKLSKRGKIRFNEGALKEANVRYGLDATSGHIIRINNDLKTYDLNAARTFGQVFADVGASANNVTVGAITSGTLSGTLSNSGKIYPSIDIMAAGEELSAAIGGKDGLLDFIKDGSIKATSKFSTNHILGGKADYQKMIMEGQTFWGLPYLTIYSGRAMRYGAQ